MTLTLLFVPLGIIVVYVFGLFLLTRSRSKRAVGLIMFGFLGVIAWIISIAIAVD